MAPDSIRVAQERRLQGEQMPSVVVCALPDCGGQQGAWLERNNRACRHRGSNPALGDAVGQRGPPFDWPKGAEPSDVLRGGGDFGRIWHARTVHRIH